MLTVLGALCALTVAELSLYPFRDEISRFNARPVSEDGTDAPIWTIRNYEEGLATAHFTPSCARLTGRRPIPNAPYILVVGDSFVAAEQLEDRSTIGGQLEAGATQAGTTVNVRQYGWIAGSPAKYIIEAPALIEKWHPSLTVVVTNADDFIPAALHDRWTDMTLPPEGGRPVISRVDVGEMSKLHVAIAKLGAHSGLLHAAVIRFGLDILPGLRQAIHGPHGWTAGRAANGSTEEAGSDGAASKKIVAADIAELRRVYGDRLFLVYVAEPGLKSRVLDEIERDVLATCGEQHVDCYSTGPDFMKARDEGRYLAAGFWNSQPGRGHYNSDGDALIASAILRV